MKKTTLFLMAVLALLFVSPAAKAQKKMQVMKGAQVLFERPVADIDSIVFVTQTPPSPIQVAAFPFNDNGTVKAKAFVIPELWNGLDIVYEVNIAEAGNLTISTADADKLHAFVMKDVYNSASPGDWYLDVNFEQGSLSHTATLPTAGKYYVVIARHAAIGEDVWPDTSYNVAIDFAVILPEPELFIEVNGVKWAASNLIDDGEFAISAYVNGKLYTNDAIKGGLNPCPDGWRVATADDWNTLFIVGTTDRTYLREYAGAAVWTPTTNAAGFTLDADTWKTTLVFFNDEYQLPAYGGNSLEGGNMFGLIAGQSWSESGWQFWGDTWDGPIRCIKK
ncbi:MAG: fibrobacter succinogenes major paralogous domain-containing protein [Dysgonamonadaceae bacterium]|jgi:uncharacterized protein (TIGR02145 family)|nr:fibrobacter succinogenes major paralogous domain-containing protein [Dysgonamonadaceae bacterium]